MAVPITTRSTIKDKEQGINQLKEDNQGNFDSAYIQNYFDKTQRVIRNLKDEDVDDKIKRLEMLFSWKTKIWVERYFTLFSQSVRDLTTN